MTAAPSILVVDDDAALRELITLRLEANGFRVEAADSGEAALARLAVLRPDAVLTDMQMAGMDGMALFNAIRSRDPALPVIVLMIDALIPYAYKAYLYNERSQAPSGLPYRFIFKSVLPIGLVLVALALLSRALRCSTLLFNFPRALTAPSDERDRTRSQP